MAADFTPAEQPRYLVECDHPGAQFPFRLWDRKNGIAVAFSSYAESLDNIASELNNKRRLEAQPNEAGSEGLEAIAEELTNQLSGYKGLTFGAREIILHALQRAVAAKGARQVVYCRSCHKTHSVLATETECDPGAWEGFEPAIPEKQDKASVLRCTKCDEVIPTYQDGIHTCKEQDKGSKLEGDDALMNLLLLADKVIEEARGFQEMRWSLKVAIREYDKSKLDCKNFVEGK